MKRSNEDGDPEKVTKYSCEEDSSIHYEFLCEYLDRFDFMVYQVTCSNDPLPWTILISNHRDNGHLRFFAQLWKAQFPRDLSDLKFCYKAWTELGLKGDYTTELVKEYASSRADAWFRREWKKVLEERYSGIEISTDGDGTLVATKLPPSDLMTDK